MGCTCCGNQSAEKFLYEKNNFLIYQCTGCGLGRTEAPEFNSKSYYDASYFNGSHADGYSDYIGARKVLYEQFKDEVVSLQKHVINYDTLLEIGCAYGYFLEAAKPYFNNVYGLEICEDAVADCHQRGLSSVKQGMLSPASLSQLPELDVVVMLDVIEHLPNPHEALQVACKKIKLGGHLIITTGDFTSLASKIRGSNWRLMTPPQHLWFFTPKSLRLLGESLDMEVVNISYPFKKVPIGLIFFQLCRLINFQPKLPAWMHRYGVKLNFFDAMRIVFLKKN